MLIIKPVNAHLIQNVQDLVRAVVTGKRVWCVDIEDCLL